MSVKFPGLSGRAHGDDATIPPHHVHPITATNRNQTFCLAGHRGQRKVLEHQPRHKPAAPRESCLPLSVQPISPEPWASFLWPYSGVKHQTLQFIAFPASIVTAPSLLPKGLLELSQGSGVTKKSLQLHHTEWCGGNHCLNN